MIHVQHLCSVLFPHGLSCFLNRAILLFGYDWFWLLNWLEVSWKQRLMLGKSSLVVNIGAIYLLASY